MEEQATTNQLDIGYTNPPPYPAPVVQTEEPPRYHAISQDIDTQQPGSKTAQQQVQLSRVIYNQPRSEQLVHARSAAQYERAASMLLTSSVFCCVVCFIFGSPLTLLCFLPAIFLSVKVCQ
jgi:hypothetical protein